MVKRAMTNPLLGPDELKELTPVEESMIALCRAKCWIVQLKSRDGMNDDDTDVRSLQRKLHGHVIIYPQKPEVVARKLPSSIEFACCPSARAGAAKPATVTGHMLP